MLLATLAKRVTFTFTFTFTLAPGALLAVQCVYVQGMLLWRVAESEGATNAYRRDFPAA